MRKVNSFLVILLVLTLSGCSTQSKQTRKADKTPVTKNVKATTNKILQADSKTWTFSKKVTSEQTKQGVSDKITPSTVSKMDDNTMWTTSKGQFLSTGIPYKRVSLKKWQHDARQRIMKSYQKNWHLMSVAQVNASLKKLGSTVKLGKLSDLIFLETSSKMTLPQAFLASGHKLYAVNIPYTDADQTTLIDRGQVFTDTTQKKKAGQVALSKLNGTWIAPETTTSANDSGKILIKDGYLYQKRYDSYERSAVQDLSSFPLIKLNQKYNLCDAKTRSCSGRVPAYAQINSGRG